jgi:hypothetical protein
MIVHMPTTLIVSHTDHLQLALVAVSKKVIFVHQFFINLNYIVNFVCTSCNWYDELRVAQATENVYMIVIDEFKSEKRLNQISMLQRVGEMCWSSHLKSIANLIKFFNQA